MRGVSHDEPVPGQFISNFMTRWGWVVTFLCLPVRFLYRILQCFMCVINFSKVSTLFSFPPPSLRRYFTKTSENGKAIENSILKTPVYFGERGKNRPSCPTLRPTFLASTLLEKAALRQASHMSAAITRSHNHILGCGDRCVCLLCRLFLIEIFTEFHRSGSVVSVCMFR